MKKYAITDTGKVRETNQDQAFVYTNSNNDSIGIICDGMGGHKAGAYASLLAAKTILDEFIEAQAFSKKNDAKEWLHQTIKKANDEVKKVSDEQEKFKGMGTTACICLVSKHEIIFANVGDSRGYVLHDNQLKLITEDQTLVNVLLKNGKINDEEALNHPNKHVLMYAIGTMDEPLIDIYTVKRSECLVFLCSDGIYNLINHNYLETILQSTLPIGQKAGNLINEANENGGFDNMSVVLMEVNMHE
ncbi:MAG: Stp1/IreP family PP2C-type Ser/Thr phosphatase [Bacilli bacterium]